MKLNGKRCVCSACGCYFTTIGVFDQHRTGPYTLADGSCGRRCRTPAEMVEIGLRKRDDGFWGGKPMREGRFWLERQAKTAAISSESGTTASEP